MTTVGDNRRDDRDNRPVLYSENARQLRDNRPVTTATDNRDDRRPLGLTSELETPEISSPFGDGGSPFKGVSQSSHTGASGLDRLLDAIHLAGFRTWLWGGTWQDRANEIGEPFPASLFGASSAGNARTAAAMKRINRDWNHGLETGDWVMCELALQEEEMLTEHLVRVASR